MALRRSSIRIASPNASINSINNLPRIDVGCSLASLNLAALNIGRGTNKTHIQKCPLET